jgi:hypothetical protein
MSLANKGLVLSKFEENRKLLIQVVDTLITVAKNDYKGIIDIPTNKEVAVKNTLQASGNINFG